MKLLLIEDDDNKRTQIETVVSETTLHSVVTAAKSLHAALRAIESEHFDMVLLDMTLPAFDVTPTEDGFRYLSYGGREFLEQLDRLEVHPVVVVVTGFDTFGEGADAITLDELDTELRAEFPTLYRGKVWYSPVIDRWKQELALFVGEVSTNRGLSEC